MCTPLGKGRHWRGHTVGGGWWEVVSSSPWEPDPLASHPSSPTFLLWGLCELLQRLCLRLLISEMGTTTLSVRHRAAPWALHSRAHETFAVRGLGKQEPQHRRCTRGPSDRGWTGLRESPGHPHPVVGMSATPTTPQVCWGMSGPPFCAHGSTAMLFCCEVLRFVGAALGEAAHARLTRLPGEGGEEGEEGGKAEALGGHSLVPRPCTSAVSGQSFRENLGATPGESRCLGHLGSIHVSPQNTPCTVQFLASTRFPRGT